MRFVFIHGAGCTADVFREQLTVFPDAGAVTLPGRDGDGTTPETIPTFADAVSSWLDGRAWRDVVVCGSSMGGAIALELGLRGDARVRGVALIGSGARLRVAPALFESLERDFAAGARALAATFFAEPAPAWIDASVEAMLRVGQAQTLRDFRACDAFDATGRMASLQVPLLAIAGDRDVLTPPKFAQWFADRVPGAAARILPDAGHLAMIERPLETNDALRAFVNRLRSH